MQLLTTLISILLQAIFTWIANILSDHFQIDISKFVLLSYLFLWSVGQMILM